MQLTSAQLISPAAARNFEPICEVLASLLPDHGQVLEIASGPGQHVCGFGRRFGHVQWQPSDADPRALASIAAWRESAALANVRPPLHLDVTAHHWPLDFNALPSVILAINLCHIAPWQVTLGLVYGAGRYLHAGGKLLVYGPFKRAGEHTAPSNAAFDQSLRRADPAHGVRDMDEVIIYANTQELNLEQIHAMPSNNFLVEFEHL
ncbi:MAG: DUF938 domain-containing protein [Gammaproteobacteria bacterium]|nr:DUF938 domain-containing protein [Gammaproteobacteria bacterium]